MSEHVSDCHCLFAAMFVAKVFVGVTQDFILQWFMYIQWIKTLFWTPDASCLPLSRTVVHRRHSALTVVHRRRFARTGVLWRRTACTVVHRRSVSWR